METNFNRILILMKEIHSLEPHLRFGQILSNAGFDNIFYTEDSDLVEMLNEFYENRKRFNDS